MVRGMRFRGDGTNQTVIYLYLFRLTFRRNCIKQCLRTQYSSSIEISRMSNLSGDILNLNDSSWRQSPEHLQRWTYSFNRCTCTPCKRSVTTCRCKVLARPGTRDQHEPIIEGRLRKTNHLLRVYRCGKSNRLFFRKCNSATSNINQLL